MNSAAGSDGFPTILFKKCKDYLTKPLFLMWRYSLDNGKIPKIMKFGNVTPIYKGDDKGVESNYHPEFPNH